MNIQLNDLLKGQPTSIKNNTFFSTEGYIKPFIERMNGITDTFECKAISPAQLSFNRDGSIIPVYNRVLVEAILPGDNYHNEIVGMTYALDSRKPVCKFFRAVKDGLNGHLYISNDKYIVAQQLEPEITLNYSYLDSLMNKDFDTFDWIQNIKSIDFDATNDNVNYKLGQWIRFAINFNLYSDFGNVKIATNDIVAGYKSLFESNDSEFYVPLANHTEYYRIYSALSKVLYDGKDIVNLPDKCILLKNILGLA